jgi:hypothetical protein
VQLSSSGRARLTETAAATTTSAGLFGTRAQLAGNPFARAVGAVVGIYGLPEEEAWYGRWMVDGQGNPLDGGRHGYTVRFPPGQLPPARFFWSATAYRLPEILLIDNPIDRYSIGDRTPGLVHDPDGGLTLRIQHQRPGDPEQAANWLPAPTVPSR